MTAAEKLDLLDTIGAAPADAVNAATALAQTAQAAATAAAASASSASGNAAAAVVSASAAATSASEAVAQAMAAQGSAINSASSATASASSAAASATSAAAAAMDASAAHAESTATAAALAGHTHALLMTQLERDKLGALPSAVQLIQDLAGKATAAQGSKADTAVQPAALVSKADLVGGKLDPLQLPDIAITDYLGAVATQAAMLALIGQRGDWCSRSDTGTVYIITGASPAVIGGWTQLAYPASAVQSVCGLVGAITAVQLATALAGLFATPAQGAKADSALQDIDGINAVLAVAAPAKLAVTQSLVSGDRILLTQKGAANGVATLGADSKIPAAQLPIFSNALLYAGGNLIANGNCYTGDVTNFAGWVYDISYTPGGASSAFKLPVSATYSSAIIGDQKISVVANKLIEFSTSMLLGSISGGNHSTGCLQYFYVNCFDTDGNEIGDAMGQTYAGSAKTTLALPLNPGDTTVTLTSAAGWAGAAAQWHQRAFKWWPFISAIGIYGYIEATGKVNLPYTYSRNTSVKTVSGGTWSSISGNVLTLSTATFPAGWTGPAIPAGTPVQNTEGGGARLYFSTLTYATPGEYTVLGTMSANSALSPTVVLFTGTAKIRIEGLLNFGGSGVSELRLGNVMLRYK